VGLEGETVPQPLVSGNDFYASPRLSPDGRQLVWLSWNHPNMPWDGTELWLATLDAGGRITDSRRVAGGKDVSIFQPRWSPEGKLHFVSDKSGWWNLYRWVEDRSEPAAPMDAEFGLPQWVFGMSTYAFASEERIVCTYADRGIWHLAWLDLDSGRLREIGTGFTEVYQVQAGAGRVVFIGSSPSETASIVELDLPTGRMNVLRRSSGMAVEPDYLSEAQALEFPTAEGTSHAFFYRPRNRDLAGPVDERPPLLVMSHGGPTGATGNGLSMGIQYWTSRGIAVLDVNYRGSTGYGRNYRQKLAGQWGVADVDDCIAGARYLAQKGLVDGKRLAIRGGSAGGYTTLCALTFHDAFAAGASRYGIGDLEALTRDTHKFESRYLDSLIGPYPECRDLYRKRSPIHWVDRLSCPVIFFQGLEDKVVPPSQAEAMVGALRRKGIPVAYQAFEGEQHGFRRAENVKRALEAELFFYAQVFGFELAEVIVPVRIENLET
jgi:dipeptidyl aminopeptidase/acylaminoacyl peptidase